MRVCLVSAEYPPMQGGVGDCTHELGSALIRLGHQVAVVTSERVQRPVRGQVRADATEDVNPCLPARVGTPAIHPVVSQWNWGSWRCVVEKVHSEQSDILHIQYQTAGYGMHPAINFLPWRLYRMKRRPRVAVTFHDLRVPYLFPKAGVARTWVTLSLARWSDAVIATNVEDYQSLRQSSLGHSSLHLIPIGSNIRPQPPAGYDRAAWRHGLGVNQDEVLLCYFGFLNESKGGEILFRCLAELRRRGLRAKLLMIGGQVGDSDPTNLAYAEHVKALGAELGLQDVILWTGYTLAEQVSASFFAADLCVLPYRDGASYRRGSFMAALAHGLPVVSTRPRVCLDTLVDEDNILLVPADDPLALANAVERLASTPGLRTRLSQGALELAKAFGWDAIASRTAQVYATLLNLPAVQAGPTYIAPSARGRVAGADDRGGPNGQ